MALPAGRVGVAPDQVDRTGKIIAGGGGQSHHYVNPGIEGGNTWSTPEACIVTLELFSTASGLYTLTIYNDGAERFYAEGMMGAASDGSSWRDIISFAMLAGEGVKVEGDAINISATAVTF